MDLGFLDRLYRGTDPIASVYLDCTRATEDAEKQIELRWRGLRESLAEHGADKETLHALDEVAGGVRGVPGPQGEALFAAGGEVIGTFTLSRPPLRDRSAFGPLPDVLELVADRDNGLPYVMVAADRVGADVYAYPAHGGPPAERSFNGGTLHIQKVHVGGFAHKQYQRRSENLWSANAAEVAADVEAAVDSVEAAAVFVGGDRRAIGKLREHLGERVEHLVIEVSGGSRADADAMAVLRDAVDRTLAETAAARRAEVIDAFTAELRREGRAVQGYDRTTEALRTGQVETLLLVGPGADTGADPHKPVLWTVPADPMEVAAGRDRLSAPDEAFEAPADAVLLRAAHATDASFTTLPEGGAADGTGALLRFTMTQ